jgi:acyl-CoA thioesterase II
MPQALLAAYKTIPETFQVHHLTTQFLHPGISKPTLTFEVIRTNDSKNNATRNVHIFQSGKHLATLCMSFIRKPLIENLSMSYQPKMPAFVDEPDESIDDIGHLSLGILKAQSLDMVISTSN